jgi:hypothetical protein
VAMLRVGRSLSTVPSSGSQAANVALSPSPVSISAHPLPSSTKDVHVIEQEG